MEETANKTPSEFVEGTFPKHVSSPILNFIRRMTFLNIENGPWVAGGALLRIFSNQANHEGDIDVFFPRGHFHLAAEDSPEGKFLRAFPEYTDCQKEGKRSPLYHFNFGKRPAVATTTSYTADKTSKTHHVFEKPNITVQFVMHRNFVSATQLINDFDYTCVMAATDGYRWVAHRRFVEDVREKRIFINNDQNRINQLGRLAKYCVRGFTPVPGTLSSILKIDDEAKFRKLFGDDPAKLSIKRSAYYT